MDRLIINNKIVYVAEEHQEIIEAWGNHTQCNVITLDHHKDTKPAFLHHAHFYTENNICNEHDDLFHKKKNEYIELLINRFKKRELTINDCIDKLMGDEHIDFAVRTNIVNKVFVLSHQSSSNGFINKRIFDGKYQKEYSNHSIIEYDFFCLPGCERAPHNDDCLFDIAVKSIDDILIGDAYNYIISLEPDFFDSYILDLDLDYFLTTRVFENKNIGTFRGLIRHSEIVTISKESECVKMHRLSNDKITSQYSLNKILEIINSL